MHSPDQRLLGNYLLLGEIARGGMGVVYQAVHTSLNRSCALKVIRAGNFASAGEKARFVLEAEATAALDHPNIVRVRHAGDVDGQLYLEMELVEGGTLADRLLSGPLPFREAAALVSRLARAVDHAHSRGVLHRDLKPGNVLLDIDGAPRLTDFGLARLLDRESDLTRTLTVLGTPAYLAPELAKGGAEAATTAADVYGLGALLYECLAGRAPYLGESPLAVLGALQAGPPLPLMNFRSGLPRDLEILVSRAMAREPASRLSSARELADEIDRWLRGDPIRSRPVPVWEQLWAWARRRRALALTAVAGALALFGGLVATSWQWRRAEGAAGRLLHELVLAENRGAELLFSANEAREAMARLAGTLRRSPGDALAATRLAAALTQRVWARPLIEVGRQDGQILHADWSPDGRVVVTADEKGALRLWDVATGDALAGEWRHGPEPCHWLGWSADGRWFASRLESGSLRVWREGASDPVLRFEAPREAVTLAVFAPTGAVLAVVRADHIVELWSPTTGNRLQSWPHVATVRAVDFTVDGRRLATADASGVVRVFDTSTGEELGKPLVARGPLRGVSWHPDGRQIALTTETNGVVELWDWVETRVRRAFRHQGSQASEFTPHGLLLRYYDLLRGVTATVPETLSQRYRLVGVDESAFGWWFCRDGRHGVMLMDGLNLRPFDLHDGTLLTEPIRTRWAIEAVAPSPDGLRVLVGAGVGRATIWQLQSSRSAVGAVLMPGRTLALGFSVDGQKVWSCDSSGALRMLDLLSPSIPAARQLPRGDFIRAAFFPDARKVAAINVRREVEVFDVDTALPAGGPWALPGDGTALSFSGDGRWLALGTDGEDVLWWDMKTDQNPGRIGLRKDAPAGALGSRVQRMDFSPDGTALGVGTYGGVAAVIEVATGRLRLRVPHPAPVWSVRFSADGLRVATACGNGVVQVWDSRTGAAVAPPLLHEDEASDVRFTPDGRHVVTAGADDSLRVWEVSTGRQVTRVSCPGKPFQLALAPSGDWMGAAMSSPSARVWDTDTGLALTERFPMPRGANRVVVAPSGRWIGLWENGSDAYLFPVPSPPPGPVPAWLAEVGEATAGLRFGPQGEIHFVTPGDAILLARRLREVVEPDPFWDSVLQRFVGAGP